MPTTELRGVDEFFNSAGVQLAPLGFGFNNDWEVIERRVVSTAIATVDFLFDDGVYDEVELIGYDILPATNDAEARITLTVDGGSTWLSSNYTYVNDRWGNGTARSQMSSGSAAFIEFVRGTGNAAGESLAFRARLTNPDSALDKYCLITGEAQSANILEWEAMGTNSTTSVLNGIRFLFDQAGADNTTAGVFVLRGRRKVQANFNSQDDWVVIEDRVGISGASSEDFFWPDQVYDQIEVVAYNITTSSANIDVDLLVSIDGSTFETAAGDYEWAWVNVNDAGTQGAAGSSSDTRIRLAAFCGAAPNYRDCEIKFQNVSKAGNLKSIKISYDGRANGGILDRANGGAHLVGSTDSIRGFSIDPAGAATFSADRIRVRGRRLTPTGVLKQDWEELARVEGPSGATVDFTDIPSSEFDEFELTWKNADCDTTSNSIELRFSNDNGATYDSGTNYHQTMDSLASNQASADVRSTAVDAIQMTGSFGSSSVRLSQGVIRFGALDAGGRKVIWFTGTNLNDVGDLRVLEGGGHWEGTGSDGVVTAFQLILGGGGNFTGGTFILRGRRK